MVEIFLNTGHQTWRHWFQSCQDGQTMEELTKDMKYYSYYLEAYTAVLGGMVGEFEIQVPKEENSNEKDPEKVWVRKYGLKAFSPIARYFPYEDYDDFGSIQKLWLQTPTSGA